MTLYHRAADMLERYGRVDGVMHCEVSMLIAELRAAAALDELVRENERLGLYDDQKPVAFSEPIAWMYQNANTDKMYLVWDKSDGGRNWMPLYAAPAPAQPRQPLSDSDVRSQFEAWVRTRPGHPFAGQFLNLMWDAWKAARAITGEKP